MNRLLTLVFLVGTISLSLTAQTVETIPNETSLTYAVKYGSVNVMESNNFIADPTKTKLARQDNKRNRNFEKRFPQNILRPELEHQGPDKLRQKDFPLTKNRPLQVFLNVDGLDNGNAPQDPSGDVGESLYLQAVNATLIAAYDKVTGEEVGRFTGNTLWQPLGTISGGDPIILYDQELSKWVITEFPGTFGANGNRLLVAVSQTEDPLGSYDVYAFNTPSFPDYPKYAVWNNAYVVTTNEGGRGVLDAYFINRDEITSGAQNVRILATQVNGTNGSEQGFIVSTPVDWSGETPPNSDTPPCTVSLADASWSFNQNEDEVVVDEYVIDWVDETISTQRTRIEVAPYDSNPCRSNGVGFSCIPQPGANGLDGLPEIITFQPHYRNFGTHESMVFNFITDVTDGDDLSGIRWIELRKTTGNPWSLFQEGTFAPSDDLHRFMCGIALDGSGNIGMAYSVSSEDTPAGLAVTGRLSTDPLGIMTLGEIPIVDGEGGLATFGRFSDYSHITTDPVNPNIFWFTGAYADGGSTATRIISFQTQNSDFDISPIDLLSPVSGPGLTSEETIEISIRNSGINPATNISVGYQFENGPLIEEVLPITLAPDQEITHAFSNQTVDMEALGEYDIKLFATFGLDQFLGNDTINRVVNHLPFLDLEVSDVRTPFESVCGETSDISFFLRNLGADAVTQATISIEVNGTLDQEFLFEGNLVSGDQIELSAAIGSIQLGSNQITVTASQPNNGIDQLPGDNSASRIVGGNTLGTPVVLNLTADGFPTETSWALFNADTNELVTDSGGPLSGDVALTTVSTQFCLNPNQCYRFEIYDEFGDGLTAIGFPDGGYEIVDQDSMVLASLLNANFGTEELNEFCLSSECNLEAEFVVEDASGTSNGSILVEVTNGRGPDFEYSIDGTNFQEDNFFDNLPGGIYTVTIRDNFGCELEQSVTVPGETAVQDIGEDGSIIIFPNPTTGEFNIRISGLNTDRVTLPVTLYNLDGQVIQRTTIATFDSVYKGMVSLFHYPKGIYLIKVDISENEHILTRVTRQ